MSHYSTFSFSSKLSHNLIQNERKSHARAQLTRTQEKQNTRKRSEGSAKKELKEFIYSNRVGNYIRWSECELGSDIIDCVMSVTITVPSSSMFIISIVSPYRHQIVLLSLLSTITDAITLLVLLLSYAITSTNANIVEPFQLEAIRNGTKVFLICSKC